MAKRDLDGAPKKAYSSKLMQMKFMQRGNKAVAAAKQPAADEPAAQPEEKQDKAEWVANQGQEGSCTVIFEGDPLPGNTSGRFSFSGQAPAPAEAEVKEVPKASQATTTPSEPAARCTKPQSAKKRRKASAIREERFDTPKLDTKGRYFFS